ncbi:MAG: hypothetical protein ABWX84_13880 [Nocardioides sp.]
MPVPLVFRPGAAVPGRTRTGRWGGASAGRPPLLVARRGGRRGQAP